MGRAGCLLLMVLLLLSPARPAAGQDEPDRVERRGAEPPLVGRVTLIDDAGVVIRSAQGAEHFIPWDRVRRLDTDRVEADLEDRLQTAETLWRARSRVERRDTTLAEPLLERLFERVRGRTHETALVVAEGLLRCRLERGANAAAVIPALEVGRLRRAGVSTASYRMLPAVVDEATALCPQLAPAWIRSRALERLQRDLEEYDARNDAAIAAIARLYLHAVRRQLDGETTEAPAALDESVAGHPGVQLLVSCLACGSDEGEQRRAARGQLRADLPNLPAWAEGWARYSLGTSLLRETGVAPRQRGLLDLVHLPARFGRSQPYLAGLALAFCAEASEAWGETAAAETFRDVLARRFPNHPVHTAPDPIRSSLTKDAQ